MSKEFTRDALSALNGLIACIDAGRPNKDGRHVLPARVYSEAQPAILLARAIIAGYHVTKPKAVKAERPTMNAVGKPYSPQFDPKYRVKHKTTTAHLFKPYGSCMSWVRLDENGVRL